jgi:cellulose synthase/poly-beta-1,6-N-acetylglucosamine synthase-like glycosyltransferase
LSDYLLIFYIACGPVVWLVFPLLMVLGYTRLSRLLTYKPASLEKVSSHVVLAVVPARNEEKLIEPAIRSILSQQHAQLRVSVVNDRSIDQTGRVLDELSKAEPALCVRHVTPADVRPGWLGKNNAIALGVEARENWPLWAKTPADQRWYWFVDSDVLVRPEALGVCLSLCQARKYAALSLLTSLITPQLWEKIFMPLAAAGWGATFAISLTNNDKNKNVGWANGQFFLIRSDAYEAAGTHHAVKSSVVEDCDLMTLIKQRGYTARFLLGPHLAATRMYSTIPAMLRGWARIYSGSSNRRFPRLMGALLFVLVCMLPGYAALIYGLYSGDVRWIVSSCLHVIVMTCSAGFMIRWSGNSPVWAALLPISLGGIVAILLRSLWMCLSGVVNWRGSEVSVQANR